MDLNTNPTNQKNDQLVPTDQNLSLTNSKPSRPDLFEANFNRHLNECKSIITFLGAFADYDLIREELNNHINLLISRS